MAGLINPTSWCGDAIMRGVLPLLLVGTLAFHNVAVQAADEAIIDCPLRDAPYSLDSPLIDVLLNPAARAILEQELATVSKTLPPQLTATETPSFAAIMIVRNVTSMFQMSNDALPGLEAALAGLEVTDADRRARCARYDNVLPVFELPDEGVRVLIFHKINGFDHGPSVVAATNAVTALADQLGWSVAVTDKGGAFNPDTLAQFDVVVWNNVSGDVLTLSQRQAFEEYINAGGGFLGIHGSGGDSVYFWDWYAQTLLGAQFIGHPMEPQFQLAQLHVEASPSGIGQNLMPGWSMKDEWYSFKESPRASGANVVATLDESTYTPQGMFGQDLRMGDDHPIVWTRCVGKGRAFYTAIGHRPEVYYIPENLLLLKAALTWTAGKGITSCQNPA